MQDSDYRYLTLDEVVAGQELQLQLYGGGDAGVLNPNSLHAAVEGPQQGWYAETPFHVAVAYLDKFVNGHPFNNGNKRAALGSAIEFLALNGLRVTTTNDELTSVVLSMFGPREQRISTEGLIAFFERVSVSEETAGSGDAVLTNIRDWMHRAYAPTFEELAK